MFIVKIDRPGWDSYTGLLGSVPFENGISARPLTDREIAFIGASIRLVKIDTDEQVGAGVNAQAYRKMSAEVKQPLKRNKEKVEPEVELKYSKDKLEEIASEGGIKAVREIANEYGVKGVQISSMIEEIIKAQKEGK